MFHNFFTRFLFVPFFTVAFLSLNILSVHSYYVKDITIDLDRSSILQSTADMYSNDDIIHWNSYKKLTSDVQDGYIPVSLLNDPVYCSMNLPSESQSQLMKNGGIDNAHIIGNTLSPLSEKLLSIGSIYPTSDRPLPAKFTVYLSNIKLFAFSKSQNSWIIIDDNPYPRGIYLYSLPWSDSTPKKCNISYTANYAKIELTAEEMNSSALHFWGRSVPLEKDDYIYYASAYTFWVDQEAVDNLTAVGGIDTKDSTGINTISQLYTSRGLASSQKPKTVWGQTVPNSEYINCNTSLLNKLYNGESLEESNDASSNYLLENTPSSDSNLSENENQTSPG
uniref:hypothetical protein n=1 Tax=Butyrivibrio sp. AC2005 TaxID=1280672 RepID=UPI0005D2CA18